MMRHFSDSYARELGCSRFDTLPVDSECGAVWPRLVPLPVPKRHLSSMNSMKWLAWASCARGLRMMYGVDSLLLDSSMSDESSSPSLGRRDCTLA